MRYFVVALDGTQYGPADLAMLRAWVIEGRIAPETILVEEVSRRTIPARSVPGLGFPETPVFQGNIGGGARRPEFGKPGDDGSFDLMWSYVCSAMSFICCGFFVLGAFVYASRAIKKGNRGGYIARIVAWIMLAVWFITTGLEIAFFRQILDSVGVQL